MTDVADYFEPMSRLLPMLNFLLILVGSVGIFFLVGAFKAVVDQTRRMADSCERSAISVVKSASVSQKSLVVVQEMQTTSERMTKVVERLALDIIRAAADGNTPPPTKRAP